MPEKKKKSSGRPSARAVAKYTSYNVYEPAELMDFLIQKIAGISRNKVKTLLTNRLILVDNKITTQYNFELKPGMKVQISKEKNKKEFRHQMLKIIYEDAYLIVVEKKEGLLSVSTENQKERTAQHILNEYVKRSHRNNRVFVVHRLDRETSGIMMYAKDEKTQNTLRDNWHDIVTDRRYVAVVAGEVERDAGKIESWLTDRKLYVSSSPYDDGTGRLAITHYKTIKRANGYSLVELKLETGRKNQIRVHMQDLGHPVVGDEKYGDEKVDPIGRLALHAFKLCFYHPVTGEVMQFETPYPTPFKNLVVRKQNG
ncbi:MULTISPECIES: RluA family pseudouridine synthase [unclassified Bacteroides]|jgi:23S rRNA pseudouridine1911/1915/1917 synthase|uniref:RluA family pseudouridine synthase n=1 Tax=unclassified Bacteroides TaxID=2646097 RepID=UPI000E81FEE0|nr:MULTISPECIES: RluA family pseudouridine synthase [unclassified Bacteroides]RGN48586.1 RluA family pseudouridine synthase [Bacteroides sp. OM05-12]RHR72447.1 RluA family pseudouridine synthase [Bacteroides sp. AF16-49]